MQKNKPLNRTSRAHFRDLALAGRDRSHHPDGFSPGRRLKSWQFEAARRAEALIGHEPLFCSLPLDFCMLSFSLPDPQAFLPRCSRTCR